MQNFAEFLPEIFRVLKSSSLANIQNLNLEFTSIVRGNFVNKFQSLRFPHLQSFSFSHQPQTSFERHSPTLYDEFLLHNPSITYLSVFALGMDETSWRQLFLNPSALPNLTEFIFRPTAIHNITDLLSPLATIIIPSTNQPRPLKHSLLGTNVVNAGIINLLSGIPTLNNIELILINLNREIPDSMDKVIPASTIKSLTKFHFLFFEPSSQINWTKYYGVPFHQPFRHLFHQTSLTSLHLKITSTIKFDLESINYLTQLIELEDLNLINYDYSMNANNSDLIDWTNSSMFTSWKFPSLTKLYLDGFHLSRESFKIIAAGSPNMTHFNIQGVVEGPSVKICVLIGHYLPLIKSIKFINSGSALYRIHDNYCKQQDQKVILENFETFQHQYPPHPRAFHQLVEFEIPICDCTLPEIWFKLLKLFNKADSIRCVENIYLYSPGPQKAYAAGLPFINTVSETSEKFKLAVMGLFYLPSLQSISDECVLPSNIYNSLTRSCSSEPEQIVYSELRDTHRNENSPHIYSPSSRKYLKMSANISKEIRLRFISRPVKNTMFGREAFFDDIFHSMSPRDQAIVTKLPHPFISGSNVNEKD